MAKERALTLEALRVMDAIDRRGSFAAAADELGREPANLRELSADGQRLAAQPLADRRVQALREDTLKLRRSLRERLDLRSRALEHGFRVQALEPDVWGLAAAVYANGNGPFVHAGNGTVSVG